jgi:hypothetical protein
MLEIQFVIDHIKNTYDMEVVPCSIPRSNSQYLKRSFYLWIYNKVSQKLFYFLRDKISPIKYLDERPGGEIWFRKRNSEGKVSIEVEIEPVVPEACIYYENESGLFKLLDKNYRVVIYDNNRNRFSPETISFLLNRISGIEQVDYYFSKNKELKSCLRNHKLKSVLNER